MAVLGTVTVGVDTGGAVLTVGVAGAAGVPVPTVGLLVRTVGVLVAAAGAPTVAVLVPRV